MLALTAPDESDSHGAIVLCGLRQRGKHIGLLVKPTARASTEHISLIARFPGVQQWAEQMP
jgi:hypothetical protein